MSILETVEKLEQDNPYAWGQRVADAKAWLYHGPTNIVSRAKKFWDGDKEQWISTENGKPVTAPVLELEDGNAFLVNPEHLVELDEKEVQLHKMAQDFLTHAMNATLLSAKNLGTSELGYYFIQRSVLKASVRATETAILRARAEQEAKRANGG